jgi:hypothetical protein
MAAQAKALQELVSRFRVSGLDHQAVPFAAARVAATPMPARTNGHGKDLYPAALAQKPHEHIDPDFRRF